MSTRKGKKPLRNIPLFYDEVKQNHNLSFTPKAWTRLQTVAKTAGVSVSELIEQWIMSDNEKT